MTTKIFIMQLAFLLMSASTYAQNESREHIFTDLLVINNHNCSSNLFGIKTVPIVSDLTKDSRGCSCDLEPSFSVFITDECKVLFTNLTLTPGCSDSLTYSWSFGDDTPDYSGITPPEHIYPASGPYEVCLIAYDKTDGSSCEEVFCRTINVECEPPCECQIFESDIVLSFDSETCEYTFTGISGLLPCWEDYAFLWDFNDGSPVTEGETVTHSFPEIGPYEVCLKVEVYDETGTAICKDYHCIDINYIGCGNGGGDVCECKLTPTFIYEEQENCHFAFEGTSGAEPCLEDSVVYTWDFGDGSIPFVGQIPPLHTFPDPGEYEVCLTVSADNGVEICETEYCESIKVTCRPSCECTELIDADFTYTFNPVTCTYNFESIIPGCFDDIDISWSWGDGSLDGTGASTMHTFTEPGTYSVTLYVYTYDSSGSPCKGSVYYVLNVGCSGTPVPEIPETGSEKPILISPNPTKDKVCVRLNVQKNNNVSINLKNARGIVIQSYEHKGELGQQQLELDLPQLTSGLYILEIILDGKLHKELLLIENN